MASDDPLLADAARFIEGHITSVAQLEMLLLLRTTPGRAWSPDDLARELRVDRAWAQAQLDAFTARGLVKPTQPPASAAPTPQGARVFAPATPELERAVTAAAQAYLLHRVRVIELVYNRPSAAVQSFADAFRLRKDPPHG